MAEMRAQAERFGAEIIQGHVTAVDLLRAPFVVRTADAEYHGAHAHHRDRRVGAAAGSAVGAHADGPRRLDLRHLRRLLLPRPGRSPSSAAATRRWRKRSSSRSSPPRSPSSTGATTLRASKIMQDKALANPKIEWLLEQRGRGHQGHRQGRGHRRWSLRDIETGRATRGAGRRRVRRHRPHAEHVAVPGPARDSTPTATSSRTTARRRACRACLRAATCRITSTGRRSPRPDRAAWPRSTPSSYLDGMPEHLRT